MKFIYYSAFVSAFLGVAFVINNFLTYIFDLPGLFGTLAFLGFGFFEITSQNKEDLKTNYEPHINYNGRLYMPIVPQTYIKVA